ncbi:uncharacterized protein LOC134812460 isoform X2 [Bolinopsis microptera]|uniref:uncharacterized protein LOC134812460 isoform X2 n=1 Tax=Bolinopsis microptera TaxID=2820187 RepID=UPI00307A249B
MVILVFTVVLNLIVSLEGCKFTVSPQFLFSLNTVEIGASCSDCNIVITKCYPFVLFRSSTDWGSDSLVNWEPPDSASCSTLGRIDMTLFGPVSEDLLLSVIPQSCTPEFEQVHVRISSFLFQNLTTETEPSQDYMEELQSPIQTDLELDLSSLTGKSSLLYWSRTGSSLITLSKSTKSTLSCPAGLLDNTPYLYELSSTILAILYNGTLSTTSSSGTTQVQIEECITRVSASSDLIEKYLFAISEDHVTDSIITNSIYRVTLDGTVSKFLDSDSNSFICSGDDTPKSSFKYTSLRFLDVLSVNSKQIILMEHISDSTTTYFYLLLNGESPTTCHKFPTSVSSVSESTSLDQVPTGPTTFRIDQLLSLHPSSPHVLGLGSVVVYSPCFGCSWYLLPVSHSAEPDAGYRVDLDKAGKYVIQTANSLYYGFFGDTIELSKLDFMGIESFTSSNLLTIRGREVVMTSFFDSDGKVGQSDTAVDLLAVEQFARENSKLEKILGGTFQKNVEVTVNANLSASFTRQKIKIYSQPTQHQEVLVHNMIPEKVYLQNGESYNLEFTFSLSSPNISDLDYLIAESHVSLNVWNGTFLEISSDKEVDYRTLKVLYTIHITDIGKANRAEPGEKIVPVSIAVFPSQACTLAPFHIMLGCKPYQKVSLSQVDTPNLLVSTTSEIIRLQYDQDFHPKFSIHDLVSGGDIPYLGNYTLTILGSGTTVEQIEMWDEGELEKFNKNGGATSVWTWKDSFKQIKWLCRERSPCANVYPKTSEGVPNFCFKIKFSNLEFTDSESYCIFEEELTICVHGLPLSIWQSIATFSVIMVFFIGTLFTLFIKKHSWRTLLEEIKIKKPEEDVDEEYEMFVKERQVRERQRASTLRPYHPGDKRQSIVNQIRMMQGGSISSGDNRNSLAPSMRSSVARSRSSRSHISQK